MGGHAQAEGAWPWQFQTARLNSMMAPAHRRTTEVPSKPRWHSRKRGGKHRPRVRRCALHPSAGREGGRLPAEITALTNLSAPKHASPSCVSTLFCSSNSSSSSSSSSSSRLSTPDASAQQSALARRLSICCRQLSALACRLLQEDTPVCLREQSPHVGVLGVGGDRERMRPWLVVPINRNMPCA